jgi:Xaa-Pro aminopeptidase
MELKNVVLPEFEAGSYPAVTREEVEQRFRALHHAISLINVDYLLVYADREHCANISYLTGGYDSRFEESLLVVPEEGLPTLVTGNEGYSYADVSLLELKKALFQTFSLQGQVRDAKRFLADVLRDECGILDTSKLGVVGLKTYEAGEVRYPEHTFDVPHYIIEELLQIVSPDQIRNVTDIMTDPEKGIRSVLTCDEIARAECMANYLSNQMKRAIYSLKIGMSEADCASTFEYKGIPFTYHPVVSFGTSRVMLGLSSPRFDVQLKEGDAVTIAFGVEGANLARTGFAVGSAAGFTGPRADIVEDFYFPYFEAMSKWYESLEVGHRSHRTYEAVMALLSDERFGVNLNPGHEIHIEEWIHSVFRNDVDHLLRSGMAFQCDIIAFPGEPMVGVHVEDPVVIADAELRRQVAGKYPGCWGRIRKRQHFMREVLGIATRDDTLPLSNLQGVLFPFFLDPAFAVAR